MPGTSTNWWRLGEEINLNTSTRDVDELLASLDPAESHPDARREVLVNYLGFPFWDVLTFTVTTGRDTCMIPLKIRRLFCGFGPGRFIGIKRSIFGRCSSFNQIKFALTVVPPIR
jgi:hypothetical protein